jgi:protocatechuate 3,4-dioxygenase beta subunit
VRERSVDDLDHKQSQSVCSFYISVHRSKLRLRTNQHNFLAGTILDPGGAVVPDAEVTLSNPEIGVALATHSDKDGFYQFREVRPSTYTLSVNAPGFAPYRKTGLELQVHGSYQ